MKLDIENEWKKMASVVGIPADNDFLYGIYVAGVSFALVSMQESIQGEMKTIFELAEEKHRESMGN